MVGANLTRKDFYDDPRISTFIKEGYEWAYMQPVNEYAAITWMHFLRRKKKPTV